MCIESAQHSTAQHSTAQHSTAQQACILNFQHLKLQLKFFIISCFVIISILIHGQAYSAAVYQNPQTQNQTPTQSQNQTYGTSSTYNNYNNYNGYNGSDFQGQGYQQGQNNSPNLNNYENYDPEHFQNQELFEQNLRDRQRTENENNNYDDFNEETPLTEEEINEYFNEILESGTTGGNTFGRLFRRLPRYGMSFFRRPPSTYAPMDSIPVAQDYRISVGDEMTLSIWGFPEEGNYNFVIRRDGTAVLPRIGTVRLAGYTFAEAESILNQRLSKYYTGYEMHLSMGRLSSIMVYVTGNARRPGAYTISSFSTLVNALIASGGPNGNGTMRRIELKRGGRTIIVFDMYAMLMKGDKTQDIRLQAGDVIYIPPVGSLIGIAGEIQQPGIYELNGTTKAEDFLYIAGGLNARTFTGRIQYFKIVDHTYASAIEGTIEEFKDTELHDGDILRLYPVFNFTSTIVITGSLLSPGTYAIIPGQTKIAEIIRRGGGLSSVSSKKAIITRITPSIDGPVHERFTVDLEKALEGDPANNIALEANDKIAVKIIPEWQGHVTVSITGEVKSPGTYYLFPGERISDLIEHAEGFTSKAFLKGAVFTRKSVAEQQKLALSNMADQLEIDLLQAMHDTKGNSAEYRRRLELINRLRNIDIIGRVVTVIDTPKNIIGTEWDYVLQNGDSIHIPENPLTVNVMGAVYSSSSQTYRKNMSINSYVNASGGAIKTAHKRMLYLIKSDGTVIKLTRNTAMLTSKQWKAPPGFSAQVEPGDTIVVPVKYTDRNSLENLRDTIDVIYKVAVSVGVILRD